MLRSLAVCGVLLTAGLAACHDKVDATTAPPDTPCSAPNEASKACIVYTDGSTFLPTFLTVSLGATVRFDIIPAGDGDGHDVTFRPGVVGAPANIPVTLNGKVDRTFNTKGVFPYDCKVHPGMSGEITVQ